MYEIMQFRLWIESFDNSVRRKLQSAIQNYLGRILRVKSFAVDPSFDDGSEMTGKSAGIRTPEGITVKEINSGIHELLHEVGFMPNKIGIFLNEGITQITAEDIGEKYNLPVVKSYLENVSLIKQLFSISDIEIKKFARKYVSIENKGKLFVDTLWEKHKDKFSNKEDWGVDPYKSMLKETPYTTGFDPYLDQILNTR